eukprot:1937287-Amphidinium_carterae.1
MTVVAQLSGRRHPAAKGPSLVVIHAHARACAFPLDASGLSSPDSCACVPKSLLPPPAHIA